jgi:hypothetical protein
LIGADVKSSIGKETSGHLCKLQFVSHIVLHIESLTSRFALLIRDTGRYHQGRHVSRPKASGPSSGRQKPEDDGNSVFAIKTWACLWICRLIGIGQSFGRMLIRVRSCQVMHTSRYGVHGSSSRNALCVCFSQSLCLRRESSASILW